MMWFASSTTVFLAGWLGGFVSGAVATLLSAMILHYWLLPAHDDHGWLGSIEMAQFLAFVAAGLVVSLLHGQLRMTVRKLDGRRRVANAQTKQLEQTRAQLELALSRFELARKATGVGSWRWEPTTGRVNWDHCVHDWFELPHANDGGVTYEQWLSRVHPDDVERALSTLNRVREDGTPQLVVYRLVLPSGVERHIRSSGIVERDANGQELGLIGIHQDVTTDIVTARELREREREVHGLNRQLEERVAERTAALLDALLHAEAATHAKAAFLRNISHELRTPRNPIICFTRLLAESITDPEQRVQLRHIETGASRMLGLVTNLIELTRSSPDETAHTALDVGAIVDAVIDTYRHAAADKGLAVESQLDLAIPKGVTGDAVRVASVLEQLLGNAIKFSARGRIELRSMLAREGPGFVCVRFEVQDEGIGIAPEMQLHVFDAFRQVRDDALARSDGLGIGLALAKRAVDRLGGEIGVNSAPGTGSTFWFTARFLLEPEVVGAGVRERRYG